MKKKKLVIISHTEHYLDKNKTVMGWGSTINEINYLSDYWQEIIHIGCLYPSQPPKSAMPYTKSNIQFVAIPPFGGKSIWDKTLIITKIPIIIYRILKAIQAATEVQLRLPTSIGIFLLPLFSFFILRKFTFWVKYAGNWNQENPPFSYKLQRWWLKKNYAKCNVTINGFWENQPLHCHSFENPCLTEYDVKVGKEIMLQKTFNQPYIFCFVGRLEPAKGVDILLDALKNIPINTIEKIHFIGDSAQREYYFKKANYLQDKAVFHGFLSKNEVHNLLSQSHFLLLPSHSEGFPKVIAEAACYGTIPVVSNVGSIAHYINDSNGFVWNILSNNPFEKTINLAINSNTNVLKNKSLQLEDIAEKFTFSNYLKKLNDFI